MSLSGTVVRIDDPWVIVEVAPNPHCQGCHVCSGLLVDDGKDRPRQVKALRGTFSLVPGQRVTVDSRPGEGSLIAVLVFGLPMIAFFLGLYLGPKAAVVLGFSSGDLQALVGGVVGMALTGGFLALGGKRGWYDRLALKVTAASPITSQPLAEKA